ncbi:asparagine synthetase [Tripterygium wilfordii]|uniref:Asparagine synthetase n=1 Tax=Tripterygium wilfordii TaxID=458696 RepID=A0A7J7C0D8_TRIWF|nr:asparagine synthetase [Tripterygium wilfordii]
MVMQYSTRLTVPGGAGVACNTAKAVEWDAAWSNNLDPLGRAAISIHLSAYDPTSTAGGIVPTNMTKQYPLYGAPGLAIRS